MSARMPPGDSAVSPPARLTLNSAASVSSPRKNRSTQAWGRSSGQRQRKKRRQRLPAHGRDVAEPARQAAMPHRLGRMPCPPEMNILQAEVGCNQGFMTPGNSKHGAVIPNADSAIQGSTTSFGFPANAGNQSFFMEGQGAINIARACARALRSSGCTRTRVEATRSLP